MSVQEREIEDDDEDESDNESLIRFSDGLVRDLTGKRDEEEEVESDEDENPGDVRGEAEIPNVQERVKDEGGAQNGAQNECQKGADEEHGETCDDEEGEERRGMKRECEQDDAEKDSGEEEESDSEEEGETCECIEAGGCNSGKRRSITCNVCLMVFKDGRHYSTHEHRWPCSKLTVPGGPEALRWLHEIFEGRLAVFMLRKVGLLLYAS